MMVAKPVPAVVYDRLRELAEAAGGIGTDEYFDDHGAPCCIYGMSYKADGWNTDPDCVDTGPHQAALRNVRVFATDNDRAVSTWRANGQHALDARMPWDDYVLAMNIVRGE